jgi:hypothetical protein
MAHHAASKPKASNTLKRQTYCGPLSASHPSRNVVSSTGLSKTCHPIVGWHSHSGPVVRLTPYRASRPFTKLGMSGEHQTPFQAAQATSREPSKIMSSATYRITAQPTQAIHG